MFSGVMTYYNLQAKVAMFSILITGLDIQGLCQKTSYPR